MNMCERIDCDLLVVGSGDGGMTAAVAAQHAGAKVIVIEKADSLGGTSAFSGGWIWCPTSPHARKGGSDDTIEAAQEYIESLSGNRFDPDRVRTYLRNGPEMVEFLEKETEVVFQLDNDFVDYRQSGRAVDGLWSLFPTISGGWARRPRC